MFSLSFDEKYAAIGTQNTQFEGAFITCVKTTGIFCRPSCRARKPKPNNVLFVDTTQQALQHGYRPCKVCKPMKDLEATPDEIQALLDELQRHPQLRIKDADLRARGVDPASIRRWFNKHHHMTFQGYQRMLRINLAYQNLSQGHSVTETAYDMGYESLSGFQYSFEQSTGAQAASHSDKVLLHLDRFTTPLGPMYAVANDDGLIMLEFTDRRVLETEFLDVKKRLNAVILPGQHPILSQTRTQIQEYFSGQRTTFSIPLQSPGTPFQQAVWQQLLKIPYGETTSYKGQAEALGKPKAVRAVATANGHNRLAIVIPCHRVVGSDGSLTGYAGGMHRKQWLLDWEHKGR